VLVDLIFQDTILDFVDLAKIYKVLDELNRLCRSAVDTLECRVDAVLESMSSMMLCVLPEDEPVTPDEFLRLTEDRCQAAGITLAKYVLVCFNFLSDCSVTYCFALTCWIQLNACNVFKIYLQLHEPRLMPLVMVVF